MFLPSYSPDYEPHERKPFQARSKHLVRKAGARLSEALEEAIGASFGGRHG